jgi:LPS export ABC transporter protein LptC
MSLPARFFSPPLLLWVLLLASCKNNLDEARLVVSRANANIEKGENVLIKYSDNGVTRIQCYGKTATRYNTEKPYLEFSDGIKIEFFKEDGSTESTLTARYATAVENSKEMVARDSVVVVNQKGERLNTDELVWDEEKKVIYSNTFVKIATADEIIYGKGFYANQNFSDYVVKSISGKIKVNASDME